MKRIIPIMLVIISIVTAIYIPAYATGGTPAGAYLNTDSGEYESDPGVIQSVIADFNFDDAAMDFTPYATQNADGVTWDISVPKENNVYINTTNTAETNLSVRFATHSNSERTSTAQAEPTLDDGSKGYFYRPYTAEQYEDQTDNIALAPSGAKKQGKLTMTIDSYNEQTAEYTPAGVVPSENELVYLDFKIKRIYAAGDDDVSVTLYDTNNSTISQLNYKTGKFPSLSIGGVSYGGDALSSENPITNYAADESWQYIRFVMDYNYHTFRLYVGNDWSELKPFISGVENYEMSSNAANLYKLYIGAKGSLGIDDLSIYTVVPPVAPAASDVTLSGKANLNETLTATYGTYSCADNSTEGASYGYWEASETETFLNAIKLTDNIPIKAGETSSYVIDSNASGKYVRFAVVPVNSAGVEGMTVYSNATSYKVDTIEVAISINGNIKNNTVFDLKHTNNYYKAQATITSTLSKTVNYTLIGAWYVTEEDAEGNKYQRLVAVKTLPISVDPASSTETGVVTATFTTDTVYTVPKGGDGTTPTMKVMLVNNLSELVPICDYKYAGTDF